MIITNIKQSQNNLNLETTQSNNYNKEKCTSLPSIEIQSQILETNKEIKSR